MLLIKTRTFFNKNYLFGFLILVLFLTAIIFTILLNLKLNSTNKEVARLKQQIESTKKEKLELNDNKIRNQENLNSLLQKLKSAKDNFNTLNNSVSSFFILSSDLDDNSKSLINSFGIYQNLTVKDFETRKSAADDYASKANTLISNYEAFSKLIESNKQLLLDLGLADKSIDGVSKLMPVFEQSIVFVEADALKIKYPSLLYDTLEKDKVRTYTIKGVDYEFQVISIDVQKKKASFSVNNQLINDLGVEKSTILVDDTELGVFRIFDDQGTSFTTFYLGKK